MVTIENLHHEMCELTMIANTQISRNRFDPRHRFLVRARLERFIGLMCERTKFLVSPHTGDTLSLYDYKVTSSFDNDDLLKCDLALFVMAQPCLNMQIKFTWEQK